MKKYNANDILRTTFSLFALLIAFSCGNTSDNDQKTQPPKEEVPAVIFTAIGDVPYNEVQRADLEAMITAHNAQNESEFVIHVGDIKPGSEPCDEAVYVDVSTLLKDFQAPTFMVLGDNEYNDCADPEQGLEYWNQYFLHFNENWQFPHTIEYQNERTENFSWVENEVLFIGINLVGSIVHDPDEWQARLSDNANWVKLLMRSHKDDTGATVVFGHANINNLEPEKFDTFTSEFRAAAAAYGKPVLYLQGDGHFWIENSPWPEKNILRVQVNGGSEAVQVTVDAAAQKVFSFDRTFLD